MLNHGERRLYKKGCRCAACTEAQRLYVAAWREAHPYTRSAAQKRAEKKYDRTRKGKARRKRADERKTILQRAQRQAPSTMKVINVRRNIL